MTTTMLKKQFQIYNATVLPLGSVTFIRMDKGSMTS